MHSMHAAEAAREKALVALKQKGGSLGTPAAGFGGADHRLAEYEEIRDRFGRFKVGHFAR